MATINSLSSIQAAFPVETPSLRVGRSYPSAVEDKSTSGEVHFRKVGSYRQAIRRWSSHGALPGSTVPCRVQRCSSLVPRDPIAPCSLRYFSLRKETASGLDDVCLWSLVEWHDWGRCRHHARNLCQDYL